MMKTIMKLFIATLLLIPALGNAQTTKEREVTAAAGDYSSSANIELSWTAGEAVIATGQTGNLIVTEGFQQADANAVGIADEMEFPASIQVYPNPVTDELKFDISSNELMDMQGSLYDISGKRIMDIPNFRVTHEYQGSLNVSQLPAGKWFLRFTVPETGMIKTFTVTKLD